MLDFNSDKKTCTGCSACVAVCAMNSITMEPDGLGYKYPVLSNPSSCIQCGLCEKICPMVYYERSHCKEIRSCYALRISDSDIWEKSTSGGAFSAICESWGDSDTYIVGVSSDNESQMPLFKCVRGVENIGEFRKSKYVQAEKNGIFRKVKDLLNKGFRVIFSGLPCQVAGLNSFLGSEKENLLTIDLVCNAEGAPKVFSEYLNALSIQHGTPLEKYVFREKRLSFKLSKYLCGRMEEYLVGIKYEKEPMKIRLSDIYTNSYIQKLHCKESCDFCCYKTTLRPGDITISDLKKRIDFFPKDKDIRTMSAIYINSPKLDDFPARLAQISDVREVSLKQIKKTVVPLSQNTPSNPDRVKFIEEFLKGDKGILILLEKYTHKKSLLMNIWGALPELLRYRIRLLLNRN